MATYYVRKDRALDGSEGPPDASGLFYWFDGTVTDNNTVWTDDANAADENTATFAYTTTTGSTNWLRVEDTTAPATGDTISSVDLWVKGGAGHDVAVFAMDVSTDGQGEQLVNTSVNGDGDAWQKSATPLSTPTGGWTWAKVQALEVTFSLSSGTKAEIAAVGVIVHTTTEGESTADPFRTIDDAANSVAAGDTVYIGAGVYRETVTIDTNGSSGSPVTWVGDVDGARTGDAGLVIISAYDTEVSTATRPECLADVSAQDVKYNTFQDLTLVGGTSAVVQFAGTANCSYEGLIFDGCVFIGGHDDADYGISVDYNNVIAPTGDGMRVRNCLFDGCGLRIVFNEDTTEKDMDILIENNVFNAGNNHSGGTGVYLDRVTASTIAPGGVLIRNNLFNGYYYAIRSIDNLTAVPTNTWDVRNNLFRSCANAITISTANPFTTDYNIYTRDSSIDITPGSNDRQETDDPGLLGGMGDWTLLRKWGWSPFRPWEPIALNDAAYVHAAIGVANSTDAPATDAYGANRPMRYTTDDVGAVEARARLEQETTTVQTGTNSARIEGSGFHDFIIAVQAASTTVEIGARFDSNYTTGTKPKLELMNAPGVTTLPSDTMTSAANTWETLSITFTPTTAGVARVRVTTHDTSTDGEAFFDDLTVT